MAEPGSTEHQPDSQKGGAKRELVCHTAAQEVHQYPFCPFGWAPCLLSRLPV